MGQVPLGKHETNFRRACLALVVAALTVATGFALLESVANVSGRYGPDFQGYRSDASQISGFFLARLLVWTVLWSIGLLIFAVPPWFVLHRLNKRSLSWAAAAGFLIPTLIILFLTTGFGLGAHDLPKGFSSSARDSGGLTMVDGVLTPHGWHSAVIAAVETGVIGLVLAIMIWRIAYRRAPPGATM